jgi:hypothetical protein
MAFDWQTVVVTLIAFAAALVIVRRFAPAKRRLKARAPGAMPSACDHCAPGRRVGPDAARTRTTPVISADELRASGRRR